MRAKAVLAALLLALSVAVAPRAAYAGPPSDFDKTLLADGLDAPTAFRFAPDGRVFIAEKNGAVRLIKNGVLQAAPMITLSTANADERGLLGLELDPDFATNHHVYLAYTHAENLDRLSRFTVTGDTIDPASELVLLKSNQQANVFHHGGEVRFGPDGKLYWSLGINVYHPNAPNLGTIHGKVLRINPDGTIPPDNPFVGVPGAEPAIWAYGLRNTFRFDMIPNGPNAGKPLGGDVGGSQFEELNLIEKGANYGWPYAEGVCSGCGFAQPVYTYPHTAPPASAGSITSVAVYTGNTFPGEYTNAVFIADYTLGFIKYLTMDETYTSVVAVHDFDLDAGTPVQLSVGPDGNLYQLDIYPGAFYRIAPSGGNRAPVARAAASPDNGLGPLDVTFSSAGSADPDGTALSYAWSFGDGATSTQPNPTHTYAGNGAYRPTLTVSDGDKTSTATVEVQVGNRRPTATITAPVTESHYDAGDTISYAGTATDPDEGALPAGAYSWSVVFHHADHVHPFLGPITGVTGGTFTIPRISDNVATTWYEIRLTVTDNGGLTHTSSVAIKPNLVRLTFKANIEGLQYAVDGIPATATTTESAVVGVQRTLSAASPQFLGGRQYLYHGWSDGQAQTHTITTPATDATYTVNFDQINPPPAPWSSDDIGIRTIAGLSSYDDGVYTVKGGGNDIWDATDEFRYVHQPLIGDGEIVARVTAQSDTYEWAKAGIMIKESATAGAPYALIGVTPGHGMHFQAKFGEDGGEFPYAFPDAWMKLTRVGDTVTAYRSADGATWSAIGSTTLAMSSTATIGLFATSHDNNVLSTAVFDNVSVVGDVDPALPAPWVHQDVGGPTVAGNATEIAGTFAVTGAGGDIWGGADQFHFVHQPLTGDGTVVAQVASQSGAEEWAKAGIMLKASATAGSPYAAMMVTPGHGTRLQANFATDLAGGAGTAPRWLKLTRAGDVVTGYESADGAGWTLVGTVGLGALPATVEVGLFVTSHDAGTAATATFDHVSVGAAAPGLPTGWNQADVGAPALLGSASVSGSTWTVAGGGNDIWNDTDQFHYAYRELAGDGTIVARPLTQGGTSDWAKSGIMIKQAASPLTPYVALFLSPGHGIHLQTGFNTDLDGGAGSVRTWLKLTRVGDAVTAYRSADGVNWTTIGTATLAGAATIGLFVTAHSGGALNTSTFDQVTVS
ncbi:PQQ-dependent sugar dehydrogenase [Paractinoplanes globisporus]|uniref:PQQ-dependent sugar dehydrogenase n=1 Tax=Paractinoplanes globisporus TaxID=113565 RepID=A0ABW6WPJ4_9ACTN|nr:PQQ-dependent sugar dehydrogenase [Actinoplanes globisporus]